MRILEILIEDLKVIADEAEAKARELIRRADKIAAESEVAGELSELHRKLDAANNLLHEKDVIIADLRRNRDALRNEVTDLRK